MELLNVNSARVTWLFDIRELNPSGKSLMPDLLDWLKETYSFDEAPKSITDLEAATKALAFNRGTFQAREEIFVDVELKIFNDGLVANTQSSTHDTEAFLESVMRSSVLEFNLAYKTDMIRRKLYFSELYVHSLKSLAGINPNVNEFTTRIMKLIPTGPNIAFNVAGLAFWPNEPVAHNLLSPFRFERKLGTVLSENRYYSTSPLHTDDHLRLLQEFEALFMS